MKVYLFVLFFLAQHLLWCEGQGLSAAKSCQFGYPSSSAICGTIAGLTCPSGYTCVTDPLVADDQGICCSQTFVKACQSGSPSGDVCGGFAGLACPTNHTCITNPMVADGAGICCPKTDVDFVQITLSIYSGRQDPVFNIFSSNPNFTSIVTTAKSSHFPGHLASILGYRGFQITLYSHGVSHTVIIGKCADDWFEDQLLQTVAQLPDTQGGLMLPSIVRQIDSDIKACTNRVTYMQIKLSIYSGTSDPQFSIYNGNANFTSIATATVSRASTPLAGILGYRGFEVILFSQGQQGMKIVTVGKCTDQTLEDRLLQTVAKLSDSSGHRLQPTIVHYIANELKGCIIV